MQTAVQEVFQSRIVFYMNNINPFTIHFYSDAVIDMGPF